MENSGQPCLENRVAALEAVVGKFQARQKDKKRRYAHEWYMKAQDRHYFQVARQMNGETATLAATSMTVGKKALIVGVAALAIGAVGLGLQIRSTFRA